MHMYGFISSVSLIIMSCLVSSTANALDDSVLIKFESEKLMLGRNIWMNNCKGCHAYGTAGAPIPMIANEWEHRVLKNKQVLYDHAINGFFGPDDTMMPERGGNENLSDEQVRLAVDYMVSLANYYINKRN